jgi:hypothetical protein
MAEFEWAWDKPRWEGPLAQRQLRLIDTLLKALAKRGHSGSATEDQGVVTIDCTIGDMGLGLGFILGNRAAGRAPHENRIDGHLPASSALALSLTTKLRTQLPNRWGDEGDLRLERRIAEIAADLIVAGEAAFREGLIKAREWDEQMARWEEERQSAELEERRKDRLANLRRSGDLLRQAQEIRELVDSVKAAVLAGDPLDVEPHQLARWEHWALREADRLDPVKSGQVLSHLMVDFEEHG